MADKQDKMTESPDFQDKKSWLSGNMAQLTVLLSGIVLAITAYAVLNILIHEIVKDDRTMLIAEAHHSIGKNIKQLEQTMQASAAMVSYSSKSSIEDTQAMVRQNIAGLQNFDRVIWLKPTEGKSWQAARLVTNDSSSYSDGSLNSLVHAVLSRFSDGKKRGHRSIVLSEPPGSQDWQEYTDPIVKGNVFAIASEVPGANQGYVVGLAKVNNLISKEWIDSRKLISRLVVRDAKTRHRLYYMNRDFSSGEEAKLIGSIQSYSFTFGDTAWEIDILEGADRQTALLLNMPWLMLGFGIVLTMIGTMYVRNNQNQSFKLATMNRQLAQKNYELNSEVNERERLNQSLRKAEREYRAIIDSVSDIIFETAADGEVTFLNDTWEDVTGFDTAQIIGRNLFDLLHPTDQEAQRSDFAALVKGSKGAYRSYTRLRTSEGTFRSVELCVSMLRHDENKNIRVVGTLNDVEERRRAEKALSEAEKKYRTIVENAAGGIYQVTPEGQFLSANQSMARILGYESPELMLRSVRNAHDSLYVSAQERSSFIRELETKGVIYNFETQVYKENGNTIWVSENARAVRDDEGNTLYYEGSMEDITSRKKAEISLMDAKRQSDLANRAKSEFLANMSHELRTPLNAIIGFSEIIKNEVLGPLENRQYWEYASDIHGSGQRLLSIINEILDVSRIEAGNRQLNEGVIGLSRLLQSCVEFSNDRIAQGKLKISNATQQIPNIIGEELAVKQVILNLLNNAIKYTPEDGRITLSFECEQNGRLRISITDTGIGMDEHEIAKALSAFGQLDTDLSRSGSGAGLGLTLAQSLMKLHGGELEIFSQKGIGTTATIIFPAKRVAEKEEDKTSAKEEDGHGVTKDDDDASSTTSRLH